MMNSVLTKLLGAFVMFSGLFSMTRSALAQGEQTDYNIHGASCVPEIETTNVSYGQYGITNLSSTSSLLVRCPLTVPYQDYTSITMIVNGYNRNANTPSICTVETTCASGGCVFSVPVSLSGNQNFPLQEQNTIYPNSGANETFFASCEIAPYTTSGYSWITELTFDTTVGAE
jgi:hypothetical protein